MYSSRLSELLATATSQCKEATASGQETRQTSAEDRARNRRERETDVALRETRSTQRRLAVKIYHPADRRVARNPRSGKGGEQRERPEVHRTGNTEADPQIKMSVQQRRVRRRHEARRRAKGLH